MAAHPEHEEEEAAPTCVLAVLCAACTRSNQQHIVNEISGGIRPPGSLPCRRMTHALGNFFSFSYFFYPSLSDKKDSVTRSAAFFFVSEV
jgi:hypothetical protein